MTFVGVLGTLLTFGGLLLELFLLMKLFQLLVGNFSHKVYQVALLSFILSEALLIFLAFLVLLFTGGRVVSYGSAILYLLKTFGLDVWGVFTG